MLSERVITETCERIAEEKPIEKRSEGLEWVMDKILPYLVVYTYKEKPDKVLKSIVQTQACYIIAKEDNDYMDLINCTANAVSSIYNSFLVIELISCDDDQLGVSWTKGKLGPVINTLEQHLADFSFGSHHLDLSVRHLDTRKENIELDNESVNKFDIQMPRWFSVEDKIRHPLLYKAFKRHMANCLKKAAFEFIRIHTSHPFSTHLMLGSAKIDKSALAADRLLSQLNSSLNFLMNVTPINEKDAWKQFCENNYEVKPDFRYRVLAYDPDLVKRQLFDLKLEQVKNPTLAYLLHEKRLEFEQKLTLLEMRETEKFKHISQSLFAPPSQNLVNVAEEIMRKLPKESSSVEKMSSDAFHTLALQEIEEYKKKFKQIPLKCEVRDDIIGLMVDGSTLFIGKSLSIPSNRAAALIQHEVGTHLLTYCNGMQQPLNLMFTGLAGYDELQEGMAVFSEYLVGGLNANRMRLLAARVIAVHLLVTGKTFCETFHALKNEYRCSESMSWKVTIRVYRGGGLTKDAVYLKGLLDLLEVLKTSGNIELLFTGKFNTHHLEFIKELYQQGTLKRPVMPNHHEDDHYQARLKQAKNKNFNIYNLIE